MTIAYFIRINNNDDSYFFEFCNNYKIRFYEISPLSISSNHNGTRLYKAYMNDNDAIVLRLSLKSANNMVRCNILEFI